jgi:hypothetical protein
MLTQLVAQCVRSLANGKDVEIQLGPCRISTSSTIPAAPASAIPAIWCVAAASAAHIALSLPFGFVYE